MFETLATAELTVAGDAAWDAASGIVPPRPTALPRWARAERADTAALLAIEAHFRDLADATPETNAFLEPAVLHAAQEADPGTPIVVLLAWEAGAEGRLVGIWAFARRGGPLGRLHAPAAPFASLATPLIRPGWHGPVLRGWLALIRADRSLPKLLEVRGLADEGPVREALDALAAGGTCARRVVARHSRPMLESGLPAEEYLKGSLSGTRRSKLRQLRAKLGRQGSLAYVVHEGAAVAAAAEQFLDLEAGGWKGRRGSAVKVDPRQAAFVRGALAGLAGRGLAAISALTLDGKPVSMCVLLRSGRTASTWKIAYDEGMRACSPGYQLALDDTAALLADPAVARGDSCAADATGILSEVWRERAVSADLFLGAGGRSPRFAAAMALMTVVRFVPELRRRLRLGTRLKPLRRFLRRAR